MIGLLCSVPTEAEKLLPQISVTRTTAIGSQSVVEGIFADHAVAVCIGGMGKVNAAHAATLLLTRFGAAAIIAFGVGGAYPASGARIGDIVLAKEEIAGDEGVLTADGFRDTRYIGIPLLKTGTSVFYNTYPAPEALLKRSVRDLASYDGNVLEGSFVTLSTCSGTTARARELEQRYHALCENMEGAAVAHVATLHQVPWLEVRAISNLVHDRDLDTWDIPKAAEAAQKAVMHLLQRWEA